MIEERCRDILVRPAQQGPVVYWMSRDQRAENNWALIKAQQESIARRSPLIVVFCLADHFLMAKADAYDFMLKGLLETAGILNEKNIPFVFLKGQPFDRIPAFLTEIKAGLLIADMNPLRISRHWKAQVAERISLSFFEVDAHNIVPVHAASPKQEYGAYTLRPKINKLLDRYLIPFPELERQILNVEEGVQRILSELTLQKQLSSYERIKAMQQVKSRIPGEKAALGALERFVESGLSRYGLHNDPMAGASSDLSPYIHFGQISAQRVALEIRQSGQEASDFLEELIVRRELADNYCHYNELYDQFEGLPSWAQASLNAHRADKRSYVYSLEAFENAGTHDHLWNAAERQLVQQGTIPSYLRMYWAKKILEWSNSPEEAQSIAVYLNDTYQLDGRDPNGYAGIAWSIGGLHDRAWGDRPVYGKVRYMNEGGCRRKFDVDKYIRSIP